MADTIAEPKFRQFSRKNGWACSWHPLQVIAWIFILYFMVVFYGCLAPSLVSPWQIVTCSITTIFVVGLLMTLAVATTLDPADESVRMKGGNKSVPQFDRTKNKHVIENQTCALCQVTVGAKSKHCSACNKCVSGFDHHCRWLNNCVGDRNYRWFLASLVFAILSSLMVVIIGIIVFVAFLTDEDEGLILQSYKDSVEKNETDTMRMFNEPVEDGVFLAFDIMTVLLAILALGLLVHLFQFHIWLIYKGLSTYDFIMMEREKMRKKEDEALREGPSPSARSQPMKANKITPSKHLEKQLSKGDDEDLKLYQKALDDREQMNRGETPPPLSSPIKGNLHFVIGDGSPTKVRKMRKKKKKKKEGSSSLQDMQVATVDSLGKHHSNGYNALCEGNELGFTGPDEMHLRQKPAPSVWKNSPSLDNPYRPKLAGHDLKQKSSERKMSQDSADSADHVSVNGTIDELNTTTMFSVNSDAKYNSDGSLNFASGQHHALPLTPIPKQKWREEVPPLDLSVLRGSTESSNSFKPYTGTSRSFDTYRHPFEQRPLPPLKSLPETVGDNATDE